MTNDIHEQKRIAGVTAANRIESGMVIGLGTGTTAIHMVRRLSERLQAGEISDVRGIPTSKLTEEEAIKLELPLTTLEDVGFIDLTIDGADEIDPHLNLMKGGGGALLREKIVAEASREMLVVGDSSKLVETMGAFKLPIEVIPFGRGSQKRFLEGLGAEVHLRTLQDGSPYHTDNHNYIYDCAFGIIEDPVGLARTLSLRAGIVEHGLFIGIATEALIVTEQGIKTIKPG